MFYAKLLDAKNRFEPQRRYAIRRKQRYLSAIARAVWRTDRAAQDASRHVHHAKVSGESDPGAAAPEARRTSGRRTAPPGSLSPRPSWRSCSQNDWQIC